MDMTVGKEHMWEGVIKGLRQAAWSPKAQVAAAALLQALLQHVGTNERQALVDMVRHAIGTMFVYFCKMLAVCTIRTVKAAAA
jgi:hypothetical protein